MVVRWFCCLVMGYIAMRVQCSLKLVQKLAGFLECWDSFVQLRLNVKRLQDEEERMSGEDE